MVAQLGDPAVVQDDDVVGVADRREAVGDHDGRPPSEEPLQGLLDVKLGLGVDAGRRLVEDEDRGSAKSARAKEMSCRWPRESPLPRSLTTVSYPSGSFSMNGRRRPPGTPRRTCSIVASGRPKRMLSAMVPENRKVSCRTMPICDRREGASRRARRARRSVTRPSVTS